MPKKEKYSGLVEKQKGRLNIKKVAFVYLIYSTESSGEYMVSKDPGLNVQRRPQLGLQYMCAVLEKKGIKTDIFDQSVTPFNLTKLIDELKSYDLAGFYCSDSQEEIVKTYCKKIKDRLNIPIVVGGPATLLNSTFLDYGCDFVVHGEGELTIQQIINFLNGNLSAKYLKGVSYKSGSNIIETPRQELIMKLDDLPFPDRSKVDINAYYDYFLFDMKQPYITAIASRGCIHKCTYCTSCRLWGYKYRQRSAKNVLDEIDEAIEKYNIRYVAFQDDIFGLSNNWMEEFCKGLLKMPYKIRWMAILHPFSFRNDTEKTLKLMKQAGCSTLSFGLQSANAGILKNIKRHPDEPRELKRIIQIANNLGFITAVTYIFGLPGDTARSIQDTVDYSLNCGSTLANFYVLSVLRGSELEIQYKNKTICKMPHNEILRLTITASRKFYTHPPTIFRIMKAIVKNPAWLVHIGIRAPSILARIGFVKNKK